MARKTIGESAQKGALALAFCVCAALPLRAEEAPAPVAAPPLSPSCEVPAVDIATPASLPNFAAALQKHQAVHILAIGSSSTVGIGSSGSNKSYPSLLEAILEHALKGVDIIVVNRGLPGEVAESTSERIRNEVALSKPDLVLWQLGTNDALARVSPADFEATVQSTIEWLKENQVDVVLVGLQYAPRLARDSNYAAIRDALKNIAAKENVLYISRYDAMRFIAKTRANLQLMSRDNFHLNDLGYQCMAEHVAHAVIISLFMKRVRPLAN